MSLITRCPFCGTQFRVVPDQLKMAEGWVRCGHCSEVFDAQLSLQPMQPARPVAAPTRASNEGEGGQAVVAEVQAQAPTEAIPAQASVAPEAFEAGTAAPESFEPPAAAEPEAPEPEAAAPEIPEPGAGEVLDPADLPRPILSVDIELESGPAPDAERTEPAPLDERTEPAALGEGGRQEPVLDFELPDDPPLDDPLPELEALDPVADADGPDAPAALSAADADTPPPATATPGEAGAGDLGFLRQARRRAFWSRPGVRMALVSLLVLLSMLLAGQVAFQQRDALAQRVPALQPAFQALCQAAGCRVGPPRRIESVVIDGSSFTRLRPDAYRLSLTLSNHASMPVAMPSLELTLTDSQDQPVLRRVLLPPDLGPGTPATLAASGEWATTLTLAVTPDASTARIVGYRLLAFYP